MEKYQRDVVSIIGTEINSITPLKIWNWLNFLLTKEYTLDVKYEMENGGNPVANAENYKPLIITINEKMASRLGVKNVVEGTQLKISVKDGSNIHPTCKSLSLMRYLCRLITPPKGIVLDMFVGSGSTLIAAKQEGFNYIGIEREEDYIKIAEARLKATPTPML
jgi:site-specific DNA-methyltransferase (adenine-specific)